ncbi:hypothetical protein AAAC51_06560 [Priestia megaterium]
MDNINFDDEFHDDWFKLIHQTDSENGITDNVNEEDSNFNGLQDMLSFIAKWGFKKEEVPVA